MFTTLLVSALAASTAQAASYVGCVDLLGLSVGSTTSWFESTLSACQNTCLGRNQDYAFYESTTNLCFCNVDSSASRGVQYGTQTSCLGYTSWALRTTFDDVTCASSLTLDSRDSGAPNTLTTYLDACFSQCATYRYAIWQPRQGPLPISYRCRCANYAPVSAPGATCGGSNFYITSHTAEEAASGLARRAHRERIKRAQAEAAANPYCPAGFRPCQVSPDAEDGYECLRTDSELESCGGCVHGQYGADANSTAPGTDCTALRGVDASSVTCRQGTCQVSRCRRGFRLKNGVCTSRF